MTEETAKVSIVVDASPKQVWDALIDPVAIKKYFMGTTVKTDWKIGNPITWSGEWKGKPFSDRGEILSCEDSKVLSYSHWSPLTGADDTPENYHVVTTTLHKTAGGTKVELTQSNLTGGVSTADRNSRADYEKNWSTMLEGLKKTVEEPTQPEIGDAHHRLDVFVGKWHTEGTSFADGQTADDPRASGVPWASDEHYEWLPGGFFLLHQWDALAGTREFKGTEIIGYDEANGGYFTRFFDNAGFHPEYTATVDGAAWKFVEPSTRATLTVREDGDQIEHVWEWLQDGEWLPLCERTATRR